MRIRLLLAVIILFPVVVFAQDEFITTWKTNNPGATDSTSIFIPTVDGVTYLYSVDWDNDGIYDDINLSDSIIHDFGVAGTYTIRISGDFPRVSFSGTGEGEKLLEVNQYNQTLKQ